MPISATSVYRLQGKAKTNELPERDFRNNLAHAALILALCLSIVFGSISRANASATVLLPAGASQAGSLYSLVQSYAEMVSAWENAIFDVLSGMGFSLGDWVDVRVGFEQHRSNERFVVEERSLDLLIPGPSTNPTSHTLNLLNPVRDRDGRLRPSVAERILPPPHPNPDGEYSDQDLEDMRLHSRLITQETYTEPMPHHLRDSSAGIEYETRRISYIQKQLLAQDSVQQYMLYAPILRGQTEIATQLGAAAEDENMNMAGLVALQVIAQTELNGHTNIALLESSLRQERILGAMLGVMAKEHHMEDIDELMNSYGL